MTAPHKPARNPRLAESSQRDALLAWRDYRATGWYVSAAAADVASAAEYDMPEDANDLPADLRFAIIDQVALLYDARGCDTDRPLGLSLAASRIVARYRGVRICPVNP